MIRSYAGLVSLGRRGEGEAGVTEGWSGGVGECGSTEVGERGTRGRLEFGVGDGSGATVGFC